MNSKKIGSLPSLESGLFIAMDVSSFLGATRLPPRRMLRYFASKQYPNRGLLPAGQDAKEWRCEKCCHHQKPAARVPQLASMQLGVYLVCTPSPHCREYTVRCILCGIIPAAAAILRSEGKQPAPKGLTLLVL